jgi:hypothetical protein
MHKESLISISISIIIIISCSEKILISMSHTSNTIFLHDYSYVVTLDCALLDFVLSNASTMASSRNAFCTTRLDRPEHV